MATVTYGQSASNKSPISNFASLQPRVTANGEAYVITYINRELGPAGDFAFLERRADGSSSGSRGQSTATEFGLSAAYLSDGSLVYAGGSGTSGLYRYDGLPFQATPTLGGVSNDGVGPALAALGGNRWAAVWSVVAAPTNTGVAGSPESNMDLHIAVLSKSSGVIKHVAITAPRFQYQGSVAALADGGFVVTWTDQFLAGNPGVTRVVAQRYDDNGNVVGANIPLAISSVDMMSDVVGLDDGGFAVAHFGVSSGVAGVRLQLFNADGTARGGLINVSGAIGGAEPSITKLGNGFLAISWTASSGGDSDLYIRYYDPNGNAVTDAIRYQGTDSDSITQRESAIAALSDGSLIAVWSDGEGAPAGSTRVAETTLYFGRTTVGDDTAETLVGDSLQDVVYGLGGNDFLHSNIYGADGVMKAGAGADQLYGGPGNDGLFAGDGDDFLVGGGENDGMVGGAGNDQLFGETGNDFLFGGAFSTAGLRLPNSGKDNFYGGSGADGLYGFDDDDILDGGEDNDYVEGGGGGDDIKGGAGSDYLLGQEGADTINGGTGFDYMYGGGLLDTFVFKKGDSADWILDFKASEGDKVRFEGFGFGAFEGVPLVDLSTPGNPAVQMTFFNTTTSAFDQLTIFGVTLAELSAANVLVA